MIRPDFIRLSPNVNPYPMQAEADTVFIHCTRSGDPGNPDELEGTLNYMSTPGTTSSHWVVGPGGEKVRVVADRLQAWHAGYMNESAWGIEVCQAVTDDPFTEAQLDALVAICRSYVSDMGVPPERVMYEDLPGFIGHEDSLQGESYGKTDPGHLFPWGWFVEQLELPIEEAIMVIHNADSPYFLDPENQLIQGAYSRGCNAEVDFKLPKNAKAVEVEVYLQTNSGPCRVCHEDPPDKAQPDNAGDYEGAMHAFLVENPNGYFKGMVNLSDDGWFHLHALTDADVRIENIHCTGYYV